MSVVSAVETAKLATCDPVWTRIREQAQEIAAREPALASFIHACVLSHDRLERTLAYMLARKLESAESPAIVLRQLFDEAMEAEPEIGEAARADIVAVTDRDPACTGPIEPVLFFKGFHALQAFRVGHRMWLDGRKELALYLQNRISAVFGVDIHPAARIGRGVMMDHATGVVIGETAVVEDDVSMLHGVTLGGTGKDKGDRHPKIGRGVLIGAGASILGNVRIGEYSRVGAGSVVLIDAPEGCTVAGVPAKVVGCAGCERPAREMDHRIPLDEPDYSI